MKEASEKKQGDRWPKAQIMASSKYQHQKDVLNALLKDGEEYTIGEVDTLISKYMEGGVK